MRQLDGTAAIGIAKNFQLNGLVYMQYAYF